MPASVNVNIGMPYFIYKISPDKKLGLVESFDGYQEAKQLATSMRSAQHPNDNYTIKIIFAKDSLEAEQLLTTQRERQPSEDD